ncbi:MAG TPA: TRAP transporter small permease subunit [Burkholderiales bacterium]|nr:TRAP transporter small permease subunit [Burkholderiales bacterium]
MLSRLLEKLSYGLIVVAMLVMSGLYFAQVIFRYLLERPLAWAGEVSVLAMLWLTFVGSAVLVRNEGFVSVALLRPEGRVKTLTSIVLDVIVVAILAVLIWYGAVLALDAREEVLPASGLSRGLVYLAIFSGALVMLLCFVEKIVLSIKKLTGA